LRIANCELLLGRLAYWCGQRSVKASLWLQVQFLPDPLRDRVVATHRSHKPEQEGSIPSPASKHGEVAEWLKATVC
jgi:hypothetical protein